MNFGSATHAKQCQQVTEAFNAMTHIELQQLVNQTKGLISSQTPPAPLSDSSFDLSDVGSADVSRATHLVEFDQDLLNRQTFGSKPMVADTKQWVNDLFGFCKWDHKTFHHLIQIDEQTFVQWCKSKRPSCHITRGLRVRIKAIRDARIKAILAQQK